MKVLTIGKIFKPCIYLNFINRMKPYKVKSTLDMVGMIEIVTNSKTTADIHTDEGGTLGALD